MPSLKTARYIDSMMTDSARNVGEWHKNDSDFAMEYTWDNDIQSKICYIYDYAHDDQPKKNKYITYENTTKKQIDAKFIITSYGSIDKDQVAYHLQFRPSEKIDFEESDDMYYYEKNYRNKFDMIYPVGLYVDIPDEKGVYCKWLIVDYEEGNQFTKYVILPCDYLLQWVDIKDKKRVKNEMWCCTRSANSYTSGLWIDRYMRTPDDVNKLLLPLNDITKSFGHVLENNENQRLILSAKTDNPLAWKVSKIENTKPIGIIKSTLKEDVFNPTTDYIEYDENNEYIIGMWADYYSSIIEPKTLEEYEHEKKQEVHCIIESSNYSINNGKSYRTLTCIYHDEYENDISSAYIDEEKLYKFTIDNEDVSEFVKYIVKEDKNKLKLKFNNDKYIGKLLNVQIIFEDENIVGEAQLEIL